MVRWRVRGFKQPSFREAQQPFRENRARKFMTNSVTNRTRFDFVCTSVDIKLKMDARWSRLGKKGYGQKRCWNRTKKRKPVKFPVFNFIANPRLAISFWWREIKNILSSSRNTFKRIAAIDDKNLAIELPATGFVEMKYSFWDKLRGPVQTCVYPRIGCFNLVRLYETFASYCFHSRTNVNFKSVENTFGMCFIVVCSLGVIYLSFCHYHETGKN